MNDYVQRNIPRASPTDHDDSQKLVHLGTHPGRWWLYDFATPMTVHLSELWVLYR